MGYLYRFFRNRPRLLIGIAAGIMTYLGLTPLSHALATELPIAKAYGDLKPVSQFLIAWVVGVWVYLGAIFYRIYHADNDSILDKAHAEDEGTVLTLILVILTAVVSLVAIVQELGVSKDAQGLLMGFHIGLTSLTIVTAWLFIHTMFALHYTHDYFLQKEQDGSETLDFPNEDNPNYWDFLYFSYIIGTLGQTADVAFNARSSRQLGTLHCTLSFFFNTAILASLINMAAGMVN